MEKLVVEVSDLSLNLFLLNKMKEDIIKNLDYYSKNDYICTIEMVIEFLKGIEK